MKFPHNPSINGNSVTSDQDFMIDGGAFSVLSGGFLMAGVLVSATRLNGYSLILFIISFIVMMIIPGHILNHKAKRGL